jgi:hypothetical protein
MHPIESRLRQIIREELQFISLQENQIFDVIERSQDELSAEWRKIEQKLLDFGYGPDDDISEFVLELLNKIVDAYMPDAHESAMTDELWSMIDARLRKFLRSTNINEWLLREVKCPSCGDANAYVGLGPGSVECPNKKCRHFSQRQHDDINVVVNPTKQTKRWTGDLRDPKLARDIIDRARKNIAGWGKQEELGVRDALSKSSSSRRFEDAVHELAIEEFNAVIDDIFGFGPDRPTIEQIHDLFNTNNIDAFITADVRGKLRSWGIN